MGTVDSVLIIPRADGLKTSFIDNGIFNGMTELKEEYVCSVSCNCDFTFQT